jgi:hypothetical protein
MGTERQCVRGWICSGSQSGTRGRIEIQIPFNAPQGEPTRLFIDDGSTLNGENIAAEPIAPCDQYMLESEAFSRAVRGDIPLPFGVTLC